MRRPFGKLMNMLDEMDTTGLTLGDVAKRTGETTERIMDAIDANKERAGTPSYITTDPEEPCYICGNPRNQPGKLYCSYPHPHPN